jgi:hypothetical protein
MLTDHLSLCLCLKNQLIQHDTSWIWVVLLVTWVHVPTISVWDFQRPIGIVALSLNHMLRNLGWALLSVFSSVSVEIALWRHVFLGLDGFSCRKSCFSKNLCYGTRYCPWISINVNVSLELVGLVGFTDRVRCSDRNFAISMKYYAFSTSKLANPDWMANWRISIIYRSMHSNNINPESLVFKTGDARPHSCLNHLTDQRNKLIPARLDALKIWSSCRDGD